MAVADALNTEHHPPFDLAELFDGLAGFSSVAIAVSGGSDSVGLLRLVEAWADAAYIGQRDLARPSGTLAGGEGPVSTTSHFTVQGACTTSPSPPGRVREAGERSLRLRTTVIALTVDHGLRPESADEAAKVSQWCAALGIDHHVLRWEGPKPSTGIQAKARAARYDLMSAFCISRGITVLLTAHTMDDQAETIVMRAARTESAAALAGIWPETDWNGVRVMRPLLGERRTALRQWLTDIGQDWFDDPSNEDERFERVRVRQTMLESDVAGLAARAEYARLEAARISGAAHGWIAAHVTQHPESHFTFDKVALLQEEPLVRRAVFGTLVARAGSGASLTVNELERLLGFLGTGGRRTLGGALIAARFREVIVVREAGRITPDWAEVGDSGVLVWDRRFRVTAPPGSHVGPVLLAPGLIRVNGIPFYVHEACPAVRLADGNVVLAGNPEMPGVSLELL